MTLFIEKRRDGGGLRFFPLAVVKGEILGMTIRVEEPQEFKEEYPFVLAGLFQEVGKSAGEARLLSGDSEEEINDILDAIASACKA